MYGTFHGILTDIDTDNGSLAFNLIELHYLALPHCIEIDPESDLNENQSIQNRYCSLLGRQKTLFTLNPIFLVGSLVLLSTATSKEKGLGYGRRFWLFVSKTIHRAWEKRQGKKIQTDSGYTATKTPRQRHGQ